jgi:hypothetical protein
MANMDATKPKELDVVELTRKVGNWAAGTRGTVMSNYRPGMLLIEVVEEDPADYYGISETLVEVPRTAVRIIEPAPSARAA